MKYLDIFGNNKVTISDYLFNNRNVKYVSIFHKTDAAFTHRPETEGEITFILNDTQGEKKFKGKNIMEVLTQMIKFLESLEQSMTVQELIDDLNKVKDKSKEVLHYDDLSIDEIEECDNYVILY